MWKTVSARIRGAKTELEDMGEDTEGMVESTSKLRDLIRGMTGFDIMEDEDTFKSIYDIIVGIGEKWGELSDIDQAALLEALAGKRAGNSLAAALNNVDAIKEAYEVAENSAGSAEQEQENYAKSIQYSIDVLKASLQELYSTLLDSDVLKDLVNSGTKFIDGLNSGLQGLSPVLNIISKLLSVVVGLVSKLTEVTNGYGTVISGVVIALALKKKFVDADTASEIKNAKATEKSTFAKTKEATASLKGALAGGAETAVNEAEAFSFIGLADSISAATVAMVEFLLTNPVGWAILAVGAIASVAGIYDLLTESVEELEEKANDAKSAISGLQSTLNSHRKTVSECADKYGELAEGVDTLTNTNENLSSEEYSEFLSITNQLADAFPDLVVGYDESGNAILNLGNNAEKTTEKLQELLNTEEQALNEEKFNKLPDLFGAVETKLDAYNNAKNKYGVISSDDYFKDLNSEDYNKKSYKFSFNRDDDQKAYNAIYSSITKFLKEQNEAGNYKYNDLLDTSFMAYDDVLGTADFSIDFSVLGEDAERFRDIINETFNDASKDYNQYSQVIEKTYKELEVSWSNYKQTMKDGMQSTTEYQALDEETRELANKIVTSLPNSMAQAIKESGKSANDWVVQDLLPEIDKIDDSSIREKIIKFLSGDINIGEKAQLAKELQDYFNSHEIEIPISTFNFDEENINKQISDFKAKYGEATSGFINTLTEDDLEYINSKEFDREYQKIIRQKSAMLSEFNDVYDDAIKEAKEKDIDLNKTIFGNLDMSNRQRIQWTEENLKKYSKAAAQNGITEADGYSTVLGTYDEFDDGLRIAFTPVLETDEGAKLLTDEEVNNYINAVVRKVKHDHPEGLSDADFYAAILKQDQEGVNSFKKDGKVVKNLIADIGETAEQTSQYMHYVGQVYDAAADAANQYGISIDDYISGTRTATGTSNDLIAALNKVRYGLDSIKPTNFAKNVSDLKDLEDNLNNLGNSIANMNADGSFNLSDLDSVADYFLGLENFDSDKMLEVNKALDTLLNGNSNIDEQASAINTLADNYLHTSNILKELNQDNKDLIELQLKSMGIVNAKDIVEATLNSQLAKQEKLTKAVTDSGYDLINITAEEIQSLVEKGTILQEDAQYVTALAIQEQLANGVLDTSADIQALLNLQQALGDTSAVLATYISFRNMANSITPGASGNTIAGKISNGIKGGLNNAADGLKQAYINDLKNKTPTVDYSSVPKAQYNGGKPVADKTKKGSGSGSDSKVNKATSVIDLFKRRVDVLNDALDLLDKNLENVVGSDAKNALLDQSMFITKEEIKNYSDAVDMYSAKAAEALAKIPEEYRDKVVNGDVSLISETVLGSAADEDDKSLKQLIDDYTGWADSVSDAKEKLAELKETLRQLELKKFQNIVDDYKNQTEIFNNSQDLINKQIDLFKEAGQVIGEGFYTALIGEENQKLALLREQQQKLVKEMENGINNGTIEKGTDEWIEMVNALKDVEGSILDSQKAIEEFNNAIQQLHWDTIERIKNDFSELSDEIQFLFDLLSDDEHVSDAFGNWSDNAMAQLGLMAQSYEQHVYASQKLQGEIDNLSAAYQRGEYSTTEYLEKLYDLKDQQRSEIDASEKAKDSIMDLAKARVDIMVDAINKEIDAMKELIDAKKEALSAEKELHSYRLSIEESTKNIAKLEAQLAAMQGDDTAATIAKRKKLEEELSNAKKDLEEKEYEHSIDTQEKALDQQMDDFEKAKNAEIEKLNKSLEDEVQVIAQAFELVKQNAATVASAITLTATEHGYQVSNTLTSSWAAGETAIGSYGKAVTDASSVFTQNLTTMQQAEWNLQTQANATAASVANVYTANADNLLYQLQSSYIAEANLKTMTDALHDSLIKCLDGGYNISSLTTQLNGVASSANSAAAAIGNMMAALSGQQVSNIDNAKVISWNNNYTGQKVYTGNDGGTQVTAAYTGKDAERKAQNAVDDYNKKKAAASKKAKGGLITKKSSGSFDPIAQSLGEDHMIAVKDNEAVLTPMQTKGWLKLVDNLDAYNNMFKVAGVKPNVPLLNNNSQPSVNITYDHLIEVQGDVNNSNIRQIQDAVENSVNEQIKQFTTSLKRVGVR